MNGFNSRWDADEAEIESRLNDQIDDLRKQQEKEIQERIAEFNRGYAHAPHPSMDLLQMRTVLEQAVRTKEYVIIIKNRYQKANLFQNKIAEQTQKENENFIIEKERKLKKELEKLTTKHDLETHALKLKINATTNEFKKNRQQEYEKLGLKYKNKIYELENNQKLEISNFGKIFKGISSKNDFIII